MRPFLVLTGFVDRATSACAPSAAAQPNPEFIGERRGFRPAAGGRFGRAGLAWGRTPGSDDSRIGCPSARGERPFMVLGRRARQPPPLGAVGPFGPARRIG